MTRTWTNVLGAVVLALVAGTPPGGTGAAGASQESEAAAARITLAEFKKLFDQNAAIVLDVRNDEAYKAGHFPGAVLVPLETVSSRAAEWKGARKPIITYCSWPDEHTSARAALLLKQAGVPNARALVGGYRAWVAAGYPIVKGDTPR